MAVPALKTLVVLLGPPAVGKMAVGKELSRLTGLPLFHNHLSIDAVLPVFNYDQPAFSRLVTNFRRAMIEEVAKSELPGVIFTFVWAFDLESDREYIERLRDLFAEHGGRTVYAELVADLETRIARNASELRLMEKSSKRDVEASREFLLHAEERYRLSSDGDFPFSPHVKIDNTELEPVEVARRIAERFELETVAER